MPDFRNSETTASALAKLGNVVRTRRKSRGLRIDDAASLCGVSVDLFSRLENGHSGVSSGKLLKILDGLGLALRIVDKATGDVPGPPAGPDA
jgi:transcriptional regulator with XRE-family HTH domain